MLAVLILAAMLTRHYWTVQIAQSLVCGEDVEPSDAMLIENFDPNYLLFERAEALERAGVARRTFVPVEASPDPTVANPVSVGVAGVMAHQARLRMWTAIPITHTEPISLNAAMQIRQRLGIERVRSVVVVAPALRSRRSALVYRAMLGPANIVVHCAPVFGASSPETWTETWHGVQEVIEEVVKLQYYRLYVLPFRARPAGS